MFTISIKLHTFDKYYKLFDNYELKLFKGVTLRVASGQQLQGYSVQLVPHQGSVKGNFSL